MEYEYIKIPKIDTLGCTPEQIAERLDKMVEDYTKGAPRTNKKTAAAVWAIIYDSAIKEITAKGGSIDGIMDLSVVKSSNGLAWIENIRGYLQSLSPCQLQQLQQPVSPIQRIYYGAPGTGKSHKAKEVTSGKKVFRTTFHPDTDYASFVGCYKPCVNNKSIVRDSSGKVVPGEFDKQIEYSFIPQTFVKAYCEAWKEYLDYYKSRVKATAKSAVALDIQNAANSQESISTEVEEPVCKNVCILIEELNRGNCAQIFGDLFQLLDRTRNGFSEYSILADSDLSKYIREDSELKNRIEDYYNIIKENSDITDEGLPLIPNWDSTNPENNEVHLCLPPNLSIVCTMNTSDQSLFPMDSAFKRRWEWEYVPIEYSEGSKSDFIICIDADHEYKWLDFLKVINDIIYEKTKSEDKQMGNFFVKGNNQKEVSCEQFVSKVMFYLWNEICKDNPSAKKAIFSKCNEKEEASDFTFSELFQSNNADILNDFMRYHKVTNLCDLEPDDEIITEDEINKANEFFKRLLEQPKSKEINFNTPSSTKNEMGVKGMHVVVKRTNAYNKIIYWDSIENMKNLRDTSSVEIEKTLGIPNDDVTSLNTSGWKVNKHSANIVLVTETGGESDERQFDWIVENVKKFKDFFSKHK